MGKPISTLATVMVDWRTKIFAIVTILPIRCVYPFVHRYFVKGITPGAVKGQEETMHGTEAVCAPLICCSILFLTGLAPARGQEPEIVPMTAFQKDATILFQGDSITDGKRGRTADPNHILGHGYAFIIAAKFGAGFADRNLTFINRGVSGNTVRDLDKRWKADTLALKPDLLSVLIGVNDNGKGVPLEEFEQTYDKLLTDARAANPKLKLVLCEPFGLPVGAKKNGWEAWYEGIKQRQAIVAKLAKKFDAAVVPFQKAFDEACKHAPADHWIWDGVHPTYSGHQIMADVWVKTVNEFFK